MDYVSKVPPILLDFSGIKSGGGAQLAVNFLDAIFVRQHGQHASNIVYVLVSDAGPLKGLVKRYKHVRSFAVPTNYFRRVLFEHWVVPKLIRQHEIEVVYTFFGAGLPAVGRASTIVTVAYPILCYPDSPYWVKAPLVPRLKAKFRNWVRKRRLRKADYLLVETEVMRKRLGKILGRDSGAIGVLPPAVTEHVREAKPNPVSKTHRFAIVSGLAHHKNLWRLAEIADCLVEAGRQDIVFDVTVQAEDFWSHVGKPSYQSKIEDIFNFLGPLNPKDIGLAYDQAYGLLILSDLESFSNNYMEAWKAGVVIVSSDRDFSQGICGESALYCEPHDVGSVVRALEMAVDDKRVKERCIKEGRRRLALLPSTAERAESIWSQILAVANER